VRQARCSEGSVARIDAWRAHRRTVAVEFVARVARYGILENLLAPRVRECLDQPTNPNIQMMGYESSWKLWTSWTLRGTFAYSNQESGERKHTHKRMWFSCFSSLTDVDKDDNDDNDDNDDDDKGRNGCERRGRRHCSFVACKHAPDEAGPRFPISWVSVG